MYKALDQSVAHSEKLAKLSDFAYRVWAQGLAASDMVGRLTANPVIFHAKAFPLIPCDREKITAAFEELRVANLCHFYEVDDKPFLVFHDHDEHNKGSKNLRHQPKSKVPPPPPSICFCVTYQPHEDGGGTAVATAVPTAVRTAIVHVPVPVHVHVPVPKGESEGEPRGSVRFLAQKWNKGPGAHLSGEKACQHIQAAIDVGVDAQALDQAFTDHNAIKGRKIWEVIDPLRPRNGEAIPPMDEILKNWAKKEAAK